MPKRVAPEVDPHVTSFPSTKIWYEAVKVACRIFIISNPVPTTKQIIRRPVSSILEGKIDDPIFEDYITICEDPLNDDTWSRGNEDDENPDHPTISPTKTISGFKIRMTVRTCYELSTGILTERYREMIFDDLGALKSMSEELERVIVQFGC